jgi:hypothetical protein
VARSTPPRAARGPLGAARRVVAAGLARLRAATIGQPVPLPDALVARYPELAQARWRVGGIAPRLGGWCLGQRSVAGITLWRTVFLARDAPMTPALLLHELRHVHQFQASRAFPAWYCWESVRRGYGANRFEVDANAFARRLLAERPADVVPVLLAGDVARLSLAEDS